MHAIDFSNDRANMAYVGETPWHGLGERLPEDTNIDQWKIAAGLDWTIDRRAVFHGVMDEQGRKTAKVIDGQKALIRSDTRVVAWICASWDRILSVTPLNADRVKDQLGLIDSQLDTFGSDIDQLAERKVSDDEAIKYFIGLYANTDKQGNVTNEKTLESVTAKLMKTYRTGPGANLASAQGTAWGLVNAVTHFVDFQTRAHSTDNRFSSGQFGIGAATKREAFSTALELAA